MNLKSYLEKKNEAVDERRMRISCLVCLRPDECCFCADVTPFKTNTHFVILMHPKEAKKQKTGTGRMTHHLLVNSEILVDESFDSNNRFKEILADTTKEFLLLYPGEDSLCLSKPESADSLDHSKDNVVVIIDGTWPCAKSMMRESECLHNLKRISFSRSLTSSFEIKQQPAQYCLSTIESVYCLLEDLDNIGLEQIGSKKKQLIDQLERLVEFQKSCASDPSRNNYNRSSKPYKKAGDRVRSIRKRNIFFSNK